MQTLAESITTLHATTFTTPSMFVNVCFSSHDATDKSYYVAGKPRTECTNRIIGYVRTSSSRSKSDFDALAEKIEDAWHAAVYGDMIEEGSDKGKRKKEVDETDKQKVARKLLAVAFLPMVAVRENGLTIPEAGKEAAWFKENMGHFETKAEEGDEDYADMLKELKERDDLKKLVAGGAAGSGGGISGLMDGLKTGGNQVSEKLGGNANGGEVDGQKAEGGGEAK